jgi:hypothetical protein
MKVETKDEFNRYIDTRASSVFPAVFGKYSIYPFASRLLPWNNFLAKNKPVYHFYRIFIVIQKLLFTELPVSL